MAERVSSARFVGRESELAELRRLVRSARDGTPAAVVIRGQAGVGKSRLAGELVSLAGAHDLTVVQGGCLDLAEAPLPFGPFVEMLRDVVRQFGQDDAMELLGPAHVELTRLLPRLGVVEDGADDATEDDADSSRARVFETVLLLLERLGARRPTLVVIEDIHWADRSTRDLLAFLIANLPAATLLVVTFRDDELPPGHWLRQFVAQLSRSRVVTTLDVRPLDRSELAAQLTDICGTRPDPSLLRAVWERSEGNPFFAEELTAAARGGDVRGLPPTLHELLLGRLQALSSETTRVLGTIAVGGRHVSHQLLATIAAARGIDEASLGPALREAVHHQALVVDDAGFSFRHALLHEVAYTQLLPGERQALHAIFGRTLEERPELLPASSVATEVARHWFLAGDADVGAALRAAVTAAHQSEEVGGFDEAHLHLERALELWDRVPEDRRPHDLHRLTLAEWAARVSDLAGDHHRAAELIERAIAVAGDAGDGTRQALLHERLGRYLSAAGDGDRALAAYGEAIGLVPPGTTAERSRVLAASARGLMLVGKYGEAQAIAAEAVDIARRAGATTEEGRALGTLGFTTALLGEIEPGLAMLDDSLRLAERGGQPDEVAEAYLLQARLTSGPLCRLDDALRIATDALRRIHELGLDRDQGVSMQALAADTLFRLGRWDEADSQLAAALTHDPLGVAGIDLCLARGKLSVGRGHFDAARDDLDRASLLAVRASDPHLLVPRCTLEAGLALWQGRVDAARVAVDEGLKHLSEADELWLLAPLVWHGLRAEAEAAPEAPAGGVAAIWDRVDALQDRAEPLRSPRATATTFATQLLAYAAMCDAEASRVRGGAAAELWADVASGWDGLGQPYPAAYARWKQAEALLAGGRRPPTARSLLTEAHEVAARLGATPFREALEQLAARARIDLPLATGVASPAALAGRSPLTPREEQVLELVTTGATNREIAGVLFISEKTVSVHVSNILAKLGARSRTDAARIAGQLGLTPSLREPERTSGRRSPDR